VKKRRLIALFFFIAVIGALFVVKTAVSRTSVTSTSHPHVLWQNMPVIALLNGDYAGTLTVGDAKRHGTLGLGTFGELDGEMLEIDGTIYQVTGDGKVHVPANDVRLSYALTTHFQSGQSIAIPTGTTFTALGPVITPHFATENTFYAIRMTGEFQAVMTRALPKQKMPYPPFCAVQKTQPTFNFTNIKGTMVGFFGPPYIGDLDTAGIHLHLLSQDGKAGGHVLSFTAATAIAEIDRIDSMDVGFPHDPMFEKMALNEIITCP
jgi:acetolactate decarboxylase